MPSQHPVQWKTQRVHLVQRHLQHPRGDLHRTGEAAGRCQDQGRGPGAGRSRWRPAPPARLAVAGRSPARRSPRRPRYRYSRARWNSSSLAARARPGPDAIANSALAFAMGEAPAGVLAGEAGQDRIAGRDRDPEWPCRERRAGGQLDPAEPAQADLGDPAAGLQPARRRDAGIDDGGAGLSAGRPRAATPAHPGRGAPPGAAQGGRGWAGSALGSSGAWFMATPRPSA